MISVIDNTTTYVLNWNSEGLKIMQMVDMNSVYIDILASSKWFKSYEVLA